MRMEWTVITALVTLVGLGISVGGPVVRLNGSITRLNTLLQAMEARLNALERDLEVQAGKAADSHRRLWARVEQQDRQLGEHETRLKLLEGGH